MLVAALAVSLFRGASPAGAGDDAGPPTSRLPGLTRSPSAAEALFREVQLAWDDRDTVRLGTLLGPDLLLEERRLADFRSKGWRNSVEVLGDVYVEYVGLVNRGGADDDRVNGSSIWVQ